MRKILMSGCAAYFLLVGSVCAQDIKPLIMQIDIGDLVSFQSGGITPNGLYSAIAASLPITTQSGETTASAVYRWTVNGLELIDYDVSASVLNVAAISDNGQAIVYTHMPTNGNASHIRRWENGVIQRIWTYDNVIGANASNRAYGMTPDGTVIVGTALRYDTISDYKRLPAVFYSSDESTHFLRMDGTVFENGSARAITPDGTRIVGDLSRHNNAYNHAQRPVYWDGVNGAPNVIGEGEFVIGSALGVSPNGKYIVGFGEHYDYLSDGYTIPFIWNEVDGVTLIFPDQNIGEATHVTNDGLVFGNLGTPGAARGGIFLWDNQNGVRYLDDILAGFGLDLRDNNVGSQLLSMSPDGNYLLVNSVDYYGDGEYVIVSLSGEIPGVITPDEIEKGVNDMPLAGQQSRSMLSNHMMQSLFVARNALSAFLSPSTGVGASADGLNDIDPAAGPSDFRGHLDARQASAYVIGSFGMGQGAEAGVDYDNHVYSGTAGILYKLNDEHIIGGGFLASHDKQNTYLGGNVTIKGYGLSGIYAYEPDMGMRFYAVASAMHLDMDTKRNYRSGSRVVQSRGKTDGFAYGGMVRLGYAMYPWRNDQWQIMPYVEGEWSRVELDAYREKRGPFPARIGKQNGDSLIGRLGGQLTYYVNPDLTLRGRAAWGHRYSDTDSLGVSVANLSFQLPHAAGARNWAEIGGTALWMMNDRAMLSFDVTGVTGRTAEPRVNAMLGLSYKF